MTSLAEAGVKSGGRFRLLWVALALSLTLNVFFIGGLVWSRMAMPLPMTPAERFAQTAEELGLSAEQKQAFEQFAHNIRQRTRQLRESNQPLMQQVWHELSSAQPDQALVARLIDEATENRRLYQKDMVTTLSRFLAALSPEQRAEFIDLAHKPQDPRAWRIRRLITP